MMRRLRGLFLAAMMMADYLIVGTWAISGVSAALFLTLLPARTAHADHAFRCMSRCMTWWQRGSSCSTGGFGRTFSGWYCFSSTCFAVGPYMVCQH